VLQVEETLRILPVLESNDCVVGMAPADQPVHWSALRKLQVAPQYLGLRGVDATILRYEVR
jgi:hypothetical protein